MAELALTCSKGEKLIFHKDGVIIGMIQIAAGKSSIAFNFPVEIKIDRERLFRKKYPSLATKEETKE